MAQNSRDGKKAPAVREPRKAGITGSGSRPVSSTRASKAGGSSAEETAAARSDSTGAVEESADQEQAEPEWADIFDSSPWASGTPSRVAAPRPTTVGGVRDFWKRGSDEVKGVANPWLDSPQESNGDPQQRHEEAKPEKEEPEKEEPQAGSRQGEAAEMAAVGKAPTEESADQAGRDAIADTAYSGTANDDEYGQTATRDEGDAKRVAATEPPPKNDEGKPPTSMTKGRQGEEAPGTTTEAVPETADEAAPRTADEAAPETADEAAKERAAKKAAPSVARATKTKAATKPAPKAMDKAPRKRTPGQQEIPVEDVANGVINALGNGFGHAIEASKFAAGGTALAAKVGAKIVGSGVQAGLSTIGGLLKGMAGGNKTQNRDDR